MTLSTQQDLGTRDQQSVLHPFTDWAAYKKEGGRTIVGGEHIYLTDSSGQQILDGMSGLWCTGLGYSQHTIINAITEQLHKLPFYNSFFDCTTDATIRLTERLVSIFPDGFNHFFYTNSGSEANDTNIRLVHRYFDLIGQPQKKIIISRQNAYHGSTIAAASLGGIQSMHEQFTALPYIAHVDQPYYFAYPGEADAAAFGIQAANKVAQMIDAIGAQNVAAFIAEPVQGAGGVVIPPETYWPQVQNICRERDVLIISDEVICGFGRTGEWFGCQTYGYQPDLITFAKAITNGYQALGGVAVCDKISDVLTSRGGEFTHGFTYSGHPAACAAAIATLDIFQTQNLVTTVQQDIGLYWAEQWRSLINHPIVGEARTQGMLGALELVRAKPQKARLAPNGEGAIYCRNQAIDAELVIRQVGDVIISAPPLIIQQEEVDLLINRLTQALDATAAHYGINH